MTQEKQILVNHGLCDLTEFLHISNLRDKDPLIEVVHDTVESSNAPINVLESLSISLAFYKSKVVKRLLKQQFPALFF